MIAQINNNVCLPTSMYAAYECSFFRLYTKNACHISQEIKYAVMGGLLDKDDEI